MAEAMRLTRRAMRCGIVRVRRFLEAARTSGADSAIHRAACEVSRTNAVRIDFERTLSIEFLHDAEEDHWAETDGRTVWINTHKQFTPDLLYYTLLHETLHGMVRRPDGHELSEGAEHRMMRLIDAELL